MADPKIVRSRVEITYTGDDGYRAEFACKSAKGVPNMAGKEVAPHAALVDAMDELTRILVLFGFETEARAAFDSACARVNAFHAQRAGQPAQGGGA